MTVTARPVPLLRRVAAATLSALVVAAIGFAATILLFFTALVVGSSGADGATLVQIGDVFLGASLIVFVLMLVFALLGVYRRWYFALVAGLVAAIVGAIVGTLLRVAMSGTAVTGTIFRQLIGTLLGINLTFVILVVLATVTTGGWIWRRMLNGSASPVVTDRHIAIVRAPAGNLADGQVTHLDRVPVDTELANRQWDGYVAALAGAGWDVVEVPIAAGQADSVFVEDAAVLFGDTAVIASPGSESRRGETAEVETTLRGLGLRIERITLPGTLDGGDVLKVGSTVYVGRGGRTNAEGIRQLRALVAPLGHRVVAVPVSTALHLKSVVTALPDGTVIGFPALASTPSLFERFLPVPEEAGAHVVVLADDTVLMSSSAPASAALVADLGYRVITVDIGEFEKLEGCVTCLSIRLR
ncbi:MAG TPA: dimethylarginine dimethylaminohydrolase [Lacisediminihabitans sp.]|uniref:dimethylargininase n=1 Tax=Lacisediminihabitans sp. TaxID=2787631 RepID=UPI002ED8C139